MANKNIPHIYRQKYDICKAIEGRAYWTGTLASWSVLLLAVVSGAYVLGWYSSTETTLLGQLFGWLI